MKIFTAKREWFGEQSLRLDASAYAEGGLEARERIRNSAMPWARLDEISTVYTESRFARVFVRDSSKGLPYLNGSDMLAQDFYGLLHLSSKRTERLAQLRLQAGWTLLSCSGTIGRTVFVRREMSDMVLSHDVIRIVPDTERVAPGYLFAFLSSSDAQAMIRQESYGSVVPHVEAHQIRDMPIPLPSSNQQELVHSRIESASEKRSKARDLLDRAAGYFVSLATPMPSLHDHALCYGVVKSSDLEARLDAFHHIGWAAEGRIDEGDRIDALGAVIATARVPRVYADRGVPFLSGIDVFRLRPDVRVRLARHVAERFDAYVKKGDLAVQGSGQRYGLVGRAAYIGARMDGWSASHDLFRIRTNRPEITARIYAFLRSDPGHRAMLRHSYGTSIPHVNPTGIASLRIPFLPKLLEEGCVQALDLYDSADSDEDDAICEVESWRN